MSSKPPDPRRLDFLAVDAIASYLRGKVALDFVRICRTCVICEHWAATSEICNLANARPPAPIIAYGCEQFEEVHPL